MRQDSSGWFSYKGVWMCVIELIILLFPILETCHQPLSLLNYSIRKQLKKLITRFILQKFKFIVY